MDPRLRCGVGPVSVAESIEAAGGEVRWLQRSDDVRLRYAVFDSPGSSQWCLLLPGYTEFIEKHLETVDDLRRRGFGVVTLDWRGQGLSSRALADRSKGHIVDFADHLGDLDAVTADAGLAESVRRDGTPLTVLGHSMGGHLALRYCANRPAEVGRAVLVAPMMGVTRIQTPGLLLVEALCALGFAGHYIFGGRPYGPERRIFDGNRLTSDQGRFERLHRLIDGNPDLAVADPTMGWVRAAMRSIAITRTPGWLEAISTPLLVAVAGRDRIVDNAATQAALARLPSAHEVMLREAEHEILGEVDGIRAAFWREVDGFLDRSQPGQV